MKIGIAHIVAAHVSTLRNLKTGKVSVPDLFIFYVLPFGVAAAAIFWDLKTSSEFYNLSVTFFGIFIALLLNVQVAIFGIFQFKWPGSADAISAEVREEKLLYRKNLLRELNINVSYLIVLSCFALALSIIGYIIPLNGRYATFLAAFVYSHFIITLLMVVKRTFAVFQGEYDHD